MHKYTILKQLHNNYLVAVVRGKSQEDAQNMIDQIIEGGIKNIEVTFTTPGAEHVIQHLQQHADDTVVIGAGTVLDAHTARIAILNGAKYIVSPNFDGDIAQLCNLYSIPYLPGCGSVTEITDALKSGVDLVKVFPGDVLGSDFIKAVHGPIPNVAMMPSGGVSIDNMDEWYQKGAYAIGIGGGLTKGAKDGSDNIIYQNTKKFVERFERIRGDKS